jgi:acyl-CoA synthetase (AMP-forming)/AMP-acid ligase II
MSFSPETGWTDISDSVFFHARQRPNAIALIEGNEHVTYAELAAWVAAASVHAGEIGVRPMDVVGVVMPSTIEHVVLVLALIRAGAVPLDLPIPQPGLGPLPGLQELGIARVFLGDGIAAPDGVTVHRIHRNWRSSLSVTRADRVAGGAEEGFYLSITSGSTGVPKAIVTTRAAWQARYRTARKLFPTLLAADPLPPLLLLGGLAFSAFFFFLTNHLFAGGTVVLAGSESHPDWLAAMINEWDDAATLITPPLAREFLARAPSGSVMFPKLRALFIGAAPFFAEEKHGVAARVSRNAFEVYGSAATGFLASHKINLAADTVGCIVDDVEVEIVDHQGNLVPAGQTGHIRCRGPGISHGIFGPVAEPPVGNEGFRNGWYYPGDLGVLAYDRFLTLRGRAADVILRNGVEIFPGDVEQAYLGHSAIGEVAVVGVREPFGARRQLVFVFAAARGELRHQDLTEHCRRLIPPERFPDQFLLLEQLPKTGNGKIDRPRLVAAAEQALRDADITAAA